MAVKIPYDIPLKGLKTKRTEAKETQRNEARRESRKRLIQKISMTCRCICVFFSGLNPDLSVTSKTTNVEHFVANFARKHIPKTINNHNLNR